MRTFGSVVSKDFRARPISKQEGLPVIITDFEFALARRNNANVARANAVIDDAGARIIKLQKKLSATQQALATAEAENAALKLQILRLTRKH
jgi:hypothetical protein